MKRIIYIILILVAFVCLSSCRGSSAKKAVDVVKKYSGKVLNKAEKSKVAARYSDDVIRHLEFEKIDCTECGGDGQTWSGTCDACSGNGYVYKIKKYK